MDSALLALGNFGALAVFSVVMLKWLLHHTDKLTEANKKLSDALTNHLKAIEQHMRLDIEAHERVLRALTLLNERMGDGKRQVSS